MCAGRLGPATHRPRDGHQAPPDEGGGDHHPRPRHQPGHPAPAHPRQCQRVEEVRHRSRRLATHNLTSFAVQDPAKNLNPDPRCLLTQPGIIYANRKKK